MRRVNLQYDGQTRHYLIYVPDNISSKIPADVVIGFHGYQGTASGLEREVTGGFNKYADLYNFIAIYPQSTYFFNEGEYISTFNVPAGSQVSGTKNEICTNEASKYPKFPSCANPSRCAYMPCSDDIGFVKFLIESLRKDNNIKKIFLFGNSTGGMFAQTVACKHPELISGVLNVNGMQTFGHNCTPRVPMNMIIYGSLNDTTIPPKNILASDGYLYESIDTIVNKLSLQFQCEGRQNKTVKNRETFVETIFTGCQNQASIVAILNLEGDHVWPETGFDEVTGTSGWVSYGYCASDLQPELKNDFCRDNLAIDSWGPRYLLEHLLKRN
jgi:poly(3-hydroxybutyrate) depolymerase